MTDEAENGATPLATFRFAVPVRGGELRVVREGQQCEIQMWAMYPGDRGMCRGALSVHVDDLRPLLHGLRYTIWSVDRDGLPLRARPA